MKTTSQPRFWCTGISSDMFLRCSLRFRTQIGLLLVAFSHVISPCRPRFDDLSNQSYGASVILVWELQCSTVKSRKPLYPETFFRFINATWIHEWMFALHGYGKTEIALRTIALIAFVKGQTTWFCLRQPQIFKYMHKMCGCSLPAEVFSQSLLLYCNDCFILVLSMKKKPSFSHVWPLL